MLAANNRPPSLQPPSIHYLEEKPFKIVKKLKPVKGSELTTRKGSTRKSISKTSKRKTIRKNVLPQCNLNESDGRKDEENSNANDPLFTPQVEIKCELDKEEKIQSEYGGQDKEEAEVYLDSDKDEDYCMEESDEEELKIYTKKKTCNKNVAMPVDEDSEDEPLILLRDTQARRVSKKRQRTPRSKSCLDTCKYKCLTKFDRQQRLDIFHYYWHLSQDDKVQFIRQSIRKTVLKRLRSNKFRRNCCYFLKHYKIGVNPESNQHENMRATGKNNTADDEGGLTKVCRKFFDATLRITEREIKEAIKDFELKPERIIHTKNEERVELDLKLPKDTQPQQYLDPKTGDLTYTKPKRNRNRRKRGEPLPEKVPKPVNCAIRCKFKCHQKFSEVERKQICDIFWSLDYKRRKDFILSRIETTDVKTPITPEFRKTNRSTRSYQTKFYLRSGIKSENIRVCKHFIQHTLCIDRWFIENAIEFADKTTGAYTGSDRRKTTSVHNKIPEELRQTVRDDINSYACWIPNKKSKTKYLHYDLSVIKMFEAYKEKCVAEQQKYVSTKYYYRVFHEDFQLLFLKNPHPKKGLGFLLSNPHVSNYTGEEAGGSWIDCWGNDLDLSRNSPAKRLNVLRQDIVADDDAPKEFLKK